MAHPFDEWMEDHPELEDDLPAAFAQWLADASGKAVIGGPVEGPPEIVAIPNEED